MPLSDASVICPACLASNVLAEQCVHCRSPLVLGGRFVATEPLSQKQSARTLGGIDQQDQRPVIIKTLSVSGMSEWKELELFERGIGVLRNLHHPGVPEHLDDGQFTRGGETFYYWVQERVEGRSLAAGLEQGQRWTEARARALAEGMLEILGYLQGFSPPIVHRDIKPSNILERQDGGWVLIDFDLVKDTLDPEGGATTALGTAGYAPMEQLMGQAVMASDLYGLGATLVAVLSRKEPSALVDTSAGRIEFREHVRVSEAFAGFIERITAPRVELRPVDARAAQRLLSGQVESPTENPPPHAPSKPLVLPPGAEDEPAPEVVSLAPSESVKLVPVGPRGDPEVEVKLSLVEEYQRPSWILPARLVITAGVVAALPASGWILALVVATIWVVTGFVFRFPVTLEPGRALYMGGISNTSEAGRHWVRRRWLDKPYSISTAPVHLRWVAGPTRVETDPGVMLWLAVELEALVQPRSDDVGQFVALLRYHSMSKYPSTLCEKLRTHVLDKWVEQVAISGVVARARRGPVALEPTEGDTLNEGFKELGWSVVEVIGHRLVLGPDEPEDLHHGVDRAWLGPSAPRSDGPD